MAGTQPGIKTTEPTPPPTVFGAVERLFTAAAVLGAGLYVLVNGLYIEFYDDFGVRPEQVGFDRLAVLARSAWVALIAIALIGPVAVIVGRRSERQLWRQVDELVDNDQSREGDDTAELRLREVLRAEHSVQAGMQRLRWISMLLVVVSVLMLAAFVLLAWLVDREAEKVSNGHNVNGLGPLVPFIDVRANRASVTWLDDEKAAPVGLVNAPYLTYLGSGDAVTVLLACGDTTHIVQSSDIAITLVDQGEGNKPTDAEETASFREACG